MKKLSHYVFETQYDGNDVFYNTVTKKWLPKNASEQELSDNFFLDGQERLAIEKKLFSVKDTAQISIIPTWECNLRCTHCIVLNKLVKKDNEFFDTDQICNFVERFLKFYNHTKAYISFVGGEPLLVAKRLINVIDKLNKLDVKFNYSITTNLATDINDDVFSFFSKLDRIIVSIDGDHMEHNTQRKPIDGNYDPFVKSIQNLKTLIKSGYQDKISVQAALRDEFITIDHKTRYYKNLLRIGILPSNIKFACIHPTKDKHASENFKKVMGNGKVVNEICCKFRMQQITIDKSEVLSDWYSSERLGSIYDQISEIESNRKKIMLDALSVLKDEKCKVCPVIGCCWGKCVNGNECFENPSKYCNQILLIENVKIKAKNRTLIEEKR